jgi:hypothetical protein
MDKMLRAALLLREINGGMLFAATEVFPPDEDGISPLFHMYGQLSKATNLVWKEMNDLIDAQAGKTGPKVG